MTDLKDARPCPFCGGRRSFDIRTLVDETSTESNVRVICKACGAMGPVSTLKKSKRRCTSKAIKAWNGEKQ